jgi:hypothetical protein
VLLDKIYTAEHQLTQHLHQLSLEGLAVALLLQFLHTLSTLLLVFHLKTSTHLQFPRPAFLLIHIMKLFCAICFCCFTKNTQSSYVTMAPVSVVVLNCVYLVFLHSYLYYTSSLLFLQGTHAFQNLTLTNNCSNYCMDYVIHNLYY